MPSDFLVYGSTGFVGNAVAHLAVQRGLRPIVAGRDAAKVEALAAELGVEPRVFGLDDAPAMDRALKGVKVVLHLAGPYIYTSKQMADGCLRNGAAYLDITGEIPVYESLAARDAEARARGVMLLPGSGFDVVPTDCLAVHLKRRLPSATRLTLAIHGEGPAGLPPGTANTVIEMIPYGDKVRRNGQLVTPERGVKTRPIDFGSGPLSATRLTWGDVFMAYFSTGIPNIEVYSVLPAALQRQMGMVGYVGPLFRLAAVRSFFKRQLKAGSTAEERAATRTSVWGEVEDDQGHKAAARLHGPEAGLDWTSRAALAVVQKVLAGNAPSGFQTPGKAYGADFVLECEGVSREDLD
jgi:short subunit dehydrogenase-like uncharacterized protein